jgi:hypothetical protein
MTDLTPLKTRTCSGCGEDRQSNEFPHSANAVCYVCTGKAKEDKLAAEMAARKAEKAEQRKQKAADRDRRRKKHDARRRRARERTVKRREERKAATAERKANERKLDAERDLEAARKAAAERRELTQQDLVKRELASRALARKHLIPYILRRMPAYQAGWVHKDIAQRLERFSEQVANGESPRLMLQMPPRTGKSQAASIFFPAWHLGKFPNHEIITCSYSGALAMGFSRKVRTELRDPDYGLIFDTKLDPDNQNAEGWMTTKGGGFTPSGVGGAITGKGANLLLVDDPVKNAEEAESQTVRQAVKDWYSSTAYTRLAPGGGVLVIQTRWHEDDLSGWLESQAESGEGDTFEIVRYPAIAIEDERYRFKGEALHPERYDEQALARIQKAVGPRVWDALYQQQPTSEDGGYFTSDMIRWYEEGELPEDLVYYTAWDFAIGKKERNDFTVGITVGVDEHENIWLVGLTRGRMDTFEMADAILDTFERYGERLVGMEKGHISMALGPYLEQRIKERRLFDFPLHELNPGRRDKELPSRAGCARAGCTSPKARAGSMRWSLKCSPSRSARTTTWSMVSPGSA